MALYVEYVPMLYEVSTQDMSSESDQSSILTLDGDIVGHSDGLTVGDDVGDMLGLLDGCSVGEI